jgi:hypothetical protein
MGKSMAKPFHNSKLKTQNSKLASPAPLYLPAKRDRPILTSYVKQTQLQKG